MLKKKYQFFISSTYEDLQEERKVAIQAVLTMEQFPIGMEMFSAADEDQWETIQKAIDVADYYILIIGNKYGTPDRSTGISYTEKEFDYAVGKGIPVLAFIVDRSANMTVDKIENDPVKMKGLNAFKEKVKNSGRYVKFWKNIDNLEALLSQSISKAVQNETRPGWVREDSLESAVSQTEVLELRKRIQDQETEIMRLKTENEGLKAQTVERMPELSCHFSLDEEIQDEHVYKVENQCRSHGRLLLENTESGWKMKLAVNMADLAREQFQRLSIYNVEPYLRPLVTKEAIQEFNKSLPDQSVIDEYIEQLRIYNAIQDGGIAFCMDISNDGTAKATDLRVNISFPKEFRVYRVSKVEDIEEPDAPKMPENPIEYAEEIYAQSLGIPAPFRQSPSLKQPYYKDLFDAKVMIPGISLSGKSWSVKENGIFAECNQIPHRDTVHFSGIYIVPLKAGTYQIKITLMCSEYVEPKEKYIQVEVVV